MVDPVTTQAAGSVATGGLTQPSAPAGPGQAASGDSAAFQEALHRPGDVPREVSSPQAGVAQAPQDAPAGKSSLASGMDRLSADIHSLKVNVEEGLANVKGDMGELIGLQFKAMQITTSMTVMGQGGQKAGQGVQQLIKGQ
jgi:hypothetical protein